MSDPSSPNVAVILFISHKVVTRALGVSIDKAKEFLQDGFRDELLKEGYVKYIKAFIPVLESHHMTETDLAFPYFRNLVPEMPYDFLNVQHDIMAKYLDEIMDAIRRVESVQWVTSGLTELLLALGALNEMWHPHIQIEETNLNAEKVAALIDREEHLRLIALYAQHFQEHFGPPQLAVPFILFNLDPGPRTILTQVMQEETVNHLVPVVWKDQWASMKPFLLE